MQSDRSNNLIRLTFSVGCSRANFDFPIDFHRLTKLLYPSNNTMDVFNAAWRLFNNSKDKEPNTQDSCEFV